MKNLILLLKRLNMPFPNVVFPVWRYPFKLGWWFHLFKLVKEKMAAEGSSVSYNLRWFDGLVWFMVFNTTFNNISVISWWSVLLVEETTDLQQVTDKLYHIMYRVQLSWAGFELTTLMVIGTECKSSYKSNYHTITIPSQTVLLENDDNLSTGLQHTLLLQKCLKLS